MQISQGPRDLNDLFDKVKVTIPSFQRNYSWTKSQIAQFLQDLYASAESDTPDFWGPVVTLRRSAATKVVEVIDGQQRITTAVVMLAILRDHTKTLANPMVNPGTPGQWPADSIVRNSLFQPNLFVQPRFEGSYLIAKVLAERIIADPETPDPNGKLIPRPPINPRGGGMTTEERKHSKELRAAYRQMNESLSKRIASQPNDQAKTQFVARLYTALTTNFEIYTLELTSEDDAFVLFESLNDRGLRLNPADILKTLTLRDISQSPAGIGVDAALDKWDDAVEALGDLEFTKFLRHYLLTHTAKPVQSRRIVSEFRELISKLNPDGALKNLNELEKSAAMYGQLLGVTAHTDSNLKSCFERLNTYSDTHRVFLLGMLRTSLPIAEQIKLGRAIEFLSYRWIAAGNNAQELESIYQKHAHSLLSDQTPTKSTEIVNDLLTAAPKDDRFALSLLESESPSLRKYLLMRIEACWGGNIPPTADLEHLAPQKPAANSAYWYAAVAADTTPDSRNLTYDDYVESWGNITLLESRLNKSIRNSDWKGKLSGTGQTLGISASNFGLNQELKGLADWTADQILHSEQWLKDCALALVSEDWVRRGSAMVKRWTPNAAGTPTPTGK